MQNFDHEQTTKSRARIHFDLISIGLVVVFLTAIHYTNYHYEMNFHILLQFGYYLPVIYAAMRFGPVGGIVSGLIITTPHSALHDKLPWDDAIGHVYTVGRSRPY
ncbi:MAG: hypothetical protein NHB14_06065 [Desulfosporosinus sp.]|nr:hypothetical protein [Desulfosporosinus sp.]